MGGCGTGCTCLSGLACSPSKPCQSRRKALPPFPPEQGGMAVQCLQSHSRLPPVPAEMEGGGVRERIQIWEQREVLSEPGSNEKVLSWVIRENTWGCTCFPVSLKYPKIAAKHHKVFWAEGERVTQSFHTSAMDDCLLNGEIVILLKIIHNKLIQFFA